MKITSSTPLVITPNSAQTVPAPTSAPAAVDCTQSAPSSAAAPTPAPGLATPGAETPSLETKVASVLRQAGLANTTVRFSDAAAAAQAQAPGNQVSFEKALGLAIESFLSDNDSSETPVALFENEFYGEDYASKLVEFMNVPGTTVDLVESDDVVEGATWYPAEHGDSIKDNWIFMLSIPAFSDHLYWAMVPRNGEAPFNYGFN